MSTSFSERIFCSPQYTLPALGLSRPPRICNNVLLPDPDAPTIAENSPSWISNEIPFNTCSSEPEFLSSENFRSTCSQRMIGELLIFELRSYLPAESTCMIPVVQYRLSMYKAPTQSPRTHAARVSYSILNPWHR